MEASYQLEETARSSSTRLMPDPLLRPLEEDDGNHTGPWPRFEALFRPPTAPRHRPITAQGMDAAAKGVLHASAAFFGPVLLQFALAQANANCDDDPADDCRVFWHWEPRSVLTTSSVVATWTAAVVLPFWGAAIDRHKTSSSSTGSSTPTSSHSSPADGRYRAGRATAYLLVALHLLQTFISSSTWFFFWIAHTLAEALNMIHQMIILAYLQDLTTDVATLTSYTSHFALIQFVAMLVFFTTVVVFAATQASPADEDDTNGSSSSKDDASLVATSRFANAVAAGFGLLVMGYAWAYLFPRHKKEVPSAHQGPPLPGSIAALSTTWYEDFQSSRASVFKLVRTIRRDYPALQWLVVTLLFSPSVGSGSYFSIFSTLHKVLVELDSSEIALANLIALSFTLVGAKLAAYLGQSFNALISFQGSLASLTLTFAGTAYWVRGPEDRHIYYACMAAMGTIMGWLLPTERVLFCTLAPSHQQAEMMSLLVAVHTALAFVPPLLFSIVTQAGLPLPWALGAQDVLLLLALAASCQIGSFDRAVAQARRPPVESWDD